MEEWMKNIKTEGKVIVYLWHDKGGQLLLVPNHDEVVDPQRERDQDLRLCGLGCLVHNAERNLVLQPENTLQYNTERLTQL